MIREAVHPKKQQVLSAERELKSLAMNRTKQLLEVARGHTRQALAEHSRRRVAAASDRRPFPSSRDRRRQGCRHAPPEVRAYSRAGRHARGPEPQR